MVEVQEEKDRLSQQASRQRAELDKLQHDLQDKHSYALEAMKSEFDKAREEQERRHAVSGLYVFSGHSQCSAVFSSLNCIYTLGSLYCKQYGPRSDCSLGSSLIRVHSICFHDIQDEHFYALEAMKSEFDKAREEQERRHAVSSL